MKFRTSILGTLLFALSLPAQAQGLAGNPITSCDLYPASGVLNQLGTHITAMKEAAATDPKCEQLLISAQAFMGSVSPFMGEAADPKLATSMELAQVVNHYNKFMNDVQMGRLCAGEEFTANLQRSVGGVAINLATSLGGVNPYSPVIGSLVSALAQHVGRMFQGPNFLEINSSQISADERAKKYSCLYRNFSNMFIGQCYQPRSIQTLISKENGAENKCLMGVFGGGMPEVLNLANTIMAIAKPGMDAPPINDSTREQLEKLQLAFRTTQITSPDGETRKSLKDWLTDAAAHFLTLKENGYPRSPGLAKALKNASAELDVMDQLLRDPESDVVALQGSLTVLSASLGSIQQNAVSASGDLAKETGVYAVKGSNEISSGESVMANKGLSLALMTYFKETMPEAYTQERRNRDVQLIAGADIEKNLRSIKENLESLNKQENEKHQAFNLIMTTVQKPIMDHMKSLQGATKPGQGRTPNSICQSHIKLAQSCTNLAGVFFYKVGNSSRNEHGGNLMVLDHAKKFENFCGRYIERGIVPSPFSRSEMRANNCLNLKGNASDAQRMACAKALQEQQCSAPAPNDIDIKMNFFPEFCPR